MDTLGPEAVPSQSHTFDDIGNRLTASSLVPSVPSVVNTSVYSSNLLNQYDSRTVPPVVDVIGSAHADATVTVNFQPTLRQGERWLGQVTVDNTAAPVYTAARVIGVRSNQGPNGEDAVAEETRHAFVARTPERFEHDVDGNLTSDGRWTYTWDAENRLIEMVGRVVPNAPSPQRLTFAYDSAGRRLAKRVYLWNLATGVWDLSSDLRFLYDGWNLVAEFSVPSTSTSNLNLVRSYTWGLDLSGSSQGAGGVGGLLQVSIPQPSAVSLFPAYDGNGNILAAYDSATGTRVADYEYGPFGEVVKSTGPAAASIPFGFSTKYTDSETGLLYYGLRYYNPSTGRWPSREPMGEQESPNLYGFVSNRPTSSFDVNGLYAIDGHFYTTYILAVSAGYPSDAAFRLAFYSQLPDNVRAYSATEGDRLPSVFVDATIRDQWLRDVQETLHSLDGGLSQKKRDCLSKMVADQSLPDWERGFLLHALADSYAHSHVDTNPWATSVDFGNVLGSLVSPTFGQEINYSWPLGHAPTTDADVIAYRPELYRKYLSSAVQSLGRSDSDRNRGMLNLASVKRYAPWALKPAVPWMREIATGSYGYDGSFTPNSDTMYGPGTDVNAGGQALHVPTRDEVQRLMDRIKCNCK